MACIEVKHLTRSFVYYEKESGYKGSIKNLFHRQKKIREVVRDISFSVEQGEFVGFIGPNGAGKTTTLKMLSGILYPTSGMAEVNGYIPWERKNAFKKQFALVAGQKSQLWPDLPAMDSFHLNKCIYEIPDQQYNNTVAELTEMLDIQDKLKVQVRRLSLGERMKMELIAALLHRPKVIFLDEPTIGLDILSQQSIREYLKEYNRKNNAVVLLTSHYIKDIEELCNRTIVISKGEKVYDGTFEGLKQFHTNTKIINLTFSLAVEASAFSRYGKVDRMAQNKVSIQIDKGSTNAVLNSILSQFPVADISITEPPIENSIEAIFNQKTKQAAEL